MAEPYREHAPPPALQHSVDCIWTRAGAAEPSRVLPDACADVILALGSSPQAFVVGPMSTAIVAEPFAGLVVGVRFRPGAARAFLHVPLDELQDRRVALDALWRDGPEVVERIAVADETGGAVAAMFALLHRRAASPAPSDPRIAAAIDRLGAGMDVAAAADHVGLTRQHLAALFRREVGQSPRVVARVLRMQRAVALIRGGHRLVDAASLAGYADQPHMTAELRELTGVTPARLG